MEARKIIITGGATRIGAAIAKQLSGPNKEILIHFNKSKIKAEILKKKLEKIVANFISTEIEWVPLNSVNIPNDRRESVIDFLEAIEDDDDVQNVYSNVKLGNI